MSHKVLPQSFGFAALVKLTCLGEIVLRSSLLVKIYRHAALAVVMMEILVRKEKIVTGINLSFSLQSDNAAEI